MTEETIVHYPTQGSQAGAQIHENDSEYKWTIFTKHGLERTYRDTISYVRFMTRCY